MTQYLVPVSDLFGDFSGPAYPTVWFGAGDATIGGSGAQITTNLWTYIDEATGAGTAPNGDGNVLLIPNNLGAGTAVYVTKLSNGSAPNGVPQIVLNYSIRNESGAITQWLIEVRQNYTNESSPGTLLGSWDDTAQIITLPSYTVISHTLVGVPTDYTALSIRIVEITPDGSRAFLNWAQLVIDGFPLERNLLEPQYRMTIFVPATSEQNGVEGVTPLQPIPGAPHSDPFKIATSEGITGFKPYLGMPQGRRGRIDVLSKKTDTGELAFTVLDNRVTPGGSNAVRWVTAFWGDAKALPRFARLYCLVEESLDGGGTWTSFFVGRVRKVELVKNSRLMMQITVRDFSDDLVWSVMVGKPHANVDMAYGAYSSTRYAQLISVSPVGLIGPYGTLPPVLPLNATVSAISNGIGHLTIAPSDHNRAENLVTASLLSAVSPASLIELFTTGASTSTQPQFTGIGIAHLTWNNGANSGDFLLGYGYTAPKLTNLTNFTAIAQAISSLSSWAIGITPLPYPIGVASGSPKANGAQSANPSAATQNVTTKGWTISITGILKAGDYISFSGHKQRYYVASDTNSDGSGNSTVVLQPGLQVGIADNEVITVQSSPNRSALPAVSTAVKLSVTLDMRMQDGGSKDSAGQPVPGNLMFINDVHPAQILKDVCLGYFSRIRRPTFDPQTGTPMVSLPPNANLGDPWLSIPMNSAAFTPLIADKTFPPFRCVVDKSIPVRDFIEQYICKPYGIGYYFDQNGNFTPVDCRQPLTPPSITISDADLSPQEAPGWQYDSAQAIPILKAHVYVEAVLPIVTRLDTSTGLPIITSKIAEQGVADIVDLTFGSADLSQKTYDFDGKGYRFMPNENSFIWNGGVNPMVMKRQDVVMAAIRRMAFATAQRPYGNGPTIITLPCTRFSQNAASIFPGTFFVSTVSALPATDTNKRGSTRVLFCTERVENGASLRFSALDWGLSSTAAVPTIGTLAAGSDPLHMVNIPVTLNASNEAVEIWVNLTATSVGSQPADTDPNWHFAGWVYSSSTFVVNNLPSGFRVWARGRTNPRGSPTITGPEVTISALELPSAWVPGGGHVDLTAITGPNTIIAHNISAHAFTVTWANGDATRMIEILLASPVTDPPTLLARLPPGSNTYTVTGCDASTTYRFYVRAIDGTGGYTQSTIDVTTTSTAVPPPPPNGTRIKHTLT